MLDQCVYLTTAISKRESRTFSEAGNMKVLLIVAFAISLAMIASGDTASDFTKKIEYLESKLMRSTRQMMLQQFFAEETRRADGSSGIKQVRYYNHAVKNYETPSHTSRAAAAIHDHANNVRTVGMGEFVAVLNGVEFRTRHNDYRLYMPHRTSKEYHAYEPIPFPEVPPSVKSQPTLDGQIEELHKWFKAWRDSDTSKYNYTKYFKPVLCYLEGGWTSTGKNIDEPFESDRHFIDADSWFDLQERVKYTSYTGTKSRLENLAYLPTTVMNFINDTIPLFAQWNYRIMCHPISRHVPLSQFNLVENLRVRMSQSKTRHAFANSRAGRFVLKEDTPGERRRGKDDIFLDKLMAEIPGKNNYAGHFYDKTIDGDIIMGSDDKPRDVSRYHRRFKVDGKDAMGQGRYARGFSDNDLFAAKTTQPKVAGLEMIDRASCTGTGKNKKCDKQMHRWTYAIPLEIIYLTPLTSWNPYNLVYRGKFNSKEGRKVVNGGRNGDCSDPKRYWNGLNSKIYYKTPEEFFSGKEHATDAADTTKGTSCVLDPGGTVRKVVASGTRVFLPEIKDVGTMRTRYPIYPVYGEGSPVWKELSALIDYVMDPSSHLFIKSNSKDGESGAANNQSITIKTGGSRVSSTTLHYHTITLTTEEAIFLQSDKKERLIKTTSHANGHEHDLKIYWQPKRKSFMYETCGGKPRCWDKHSIVLTTLKN